MEHLDHHVLLGGLLGIIRYEDLVLVLTMGLPTSYSTFVVALDATDPTLLTLDNVIARLLNEESRLSAESPRSTTTNSVNEAMDAIPSSPRRPLSQITCFACGKGPLLTELPIEIEFFSCRYSCHRGIGV